MLSGATFSSASVAFSMPPATRRTPPFSASAATSLVSCFHSMSNGQAACSGCDCSACKSACQCMQLEALCLCPNSFALGSAMHRSATPMWPRRSNHADSSCEKYCAGWSQGVASCRRFDQTPSSSGSGRSVLAKSAAARSPDHTYSVMQIRRSLSTFLLACAQAHFGRGALRDLPTAVAENTQVRGRAVKALERCMRTNCSMRCGGQCN
jgi:hypothetical protein